MRTLDLWIEYVYHTGDAHVYLIHEDEAYTLAQQAVTYKVNLEDWNLPMYPLPDVHSFLYNMHHVMLF